MARSKTTKFIVTTGDFLLEWILAILGLILLIAAFMHGLAHGTPEYPYSPLSYVEIAVVFILIFLIPAYVISAVISAIKRNWSGVRVIMVNLCFGMAFLYGALISDAPTLIHMT